MAVPPLNDRHAVPGAWGIEPSRPACTLVWWQDNVTVRTQIAEGTPPSPNRMLHAGGETLSGKDMGDSTRPWVGEWGCKCTICRSLGAAKAVLDPLGSGDYSSGTVFPLYRPGPLETAACSVPGAGMTIPPV